MTGLKTKIQETLRTMSSNAHHMVDEIADDDALSSGSLLKPINRGRSGPRHRKRWQTKHPLRELRLMKGLTLEELAEQTDLSPSYLSRLESGSRRLNADIMQNLATALSCHPGDLLPGGKSEVGAYLHGEINPAASNQNTQAHTLPLYHLASTPDGIQTIDFAHPTEWMARPAELTEATKAFAISMPNDAMAPRYFAGERLLAHPSKALTQRCFVVVTTKQDHVIVAQFNGWQSAEIIDTSMGPIEANDMDKLVLLQIGDRVPLMPGVERQGTALMIPRKNISTISRIVGNLEAA